MATLKWIVFAVCLLWAIGGAIVMLGYGAGSNPTTLALSALIDFGPLVLSFLWIVIAARRSPTETRPGGINIRSPP